MIIIKLNISSVRNIIKAAVYPSPTLNFIVGKNASGKSAFLEAIFLLGRIKSFRSTAIKSVINSSQLELVVSAEILQINGATAHLGVQIDSKNYYCRINHQTTHKKSDFAYALPLQVIHPKSYELLDAAPQLRREFLDWGVFNDNDSFLLTWRNYKKALAHRNSLLKTRSLKQLNVWNNELVYYGTMVNKKINYPKPRLPQQLVVHKEEYKKADIAEIKKYNLLMTKYYEYFVLVKSMDWFERIIVRTQLHNASEFYMKLVNKYGFWFK